MPYSLLLRIVGKEDIHKPMTPFLTTLDKVMKEMTIHH